MRLKLQISMAETQVKKLKEQVLNGGNETAVAEVDAKEVETLRQQAAQYTQAVEEMV